MNGAGRGTGADRLDGGPGPDMLSGNGFEFDDGSVDIFIFGAGDGDDTILDFVNNQDKIDLSAFNLSGFDELTLFSDDFGDVTIDLSEHGGGTIQLILINITDMDVTDFLF